MQIAYDLDTQLGGHGSENGVLSEVGNGYF